jgi:hypothetical protein
MSEHTNDRLQGTIADLRLCNAAQSDVIANLEEYQRTIVGLATSPEESPGGIRGCYGPELNYLHSRRHALDSLIAAVERYRDVAVGWSPEAGLYSEKEQLAPGD